MNDVTLNSTDLKLARPGEAVPARALSSSQAEGKDASEPAFSSVGCDVQNQLVPQAQDVSKAEQLQKRNEAQREALNGAVLRIERHVQNVQRDCSLRWTMSWARHRESSGSEDPAGEFGKFLTNWR